MQQPGQTVPAVTKLEEKMMKTGKGFTLVELLVVMAIMGLLATVGLSSFHSSQLKSRDARRKSDLEQVQRALEMYYNDHGGYPASQDGKIKITVPLTWGVDGMADSQGTIYMKELPGDPIGSPEYCYLFVAGSPVGYKLYAKLENKQDPKATLQVNCGSVTDKSYNYGVASSNQTP